MKIIVCKNCSAQIFASDLRAPVCGRCGTRLMELSRQRFWRALRRFTILVMAAGLTGCLFYFRDSVLTNVSALLKEMPATDSRVAWIIALGAGGVAAIVALAGRRRPRAFGTAKAHEVPQGSNIKRKIELLATRAWGSREDILTAALHLDVKSVNATESHADVIKAYLRHVARVAPKLDVPTMTPRIVTERLCDAAGKFIEEDGWVKIVVDAHFFDNRPVAQAILCHEVCHYVLEANGIREQPTLENERMTDAAIFVFGLGDVFLAGYHKSPSRQYRAGHRLGYLTDDEYRFARQHVDWLRRSEEFLRTAKGRRDDWNWDRSLR